MGAPREAVADYLESRRQLKSAWDSFHRRAYRHTFIHCRLAALHLVESVVRLGGREPGAEPLEPFLEVLRDLLPLEKASGFDSILHAPELRPLGKVHRANLSESANDWLVTRRIERGRAFEYLTLTQDSINAVITCMETKFPGFFTF